MANTRRERVRELAQDDELAGSQCTLCEKPLQAGEQVVQCPRCKAAHHLQCWTEKGGCSTRGCSQVADPTLTGATPVHRDPPARDQIWIPGLAAGLVAVLLVGAILWGLYGPKSEEGTVITLLTASGPGIEALQQTALDYGESHDDVDGVDVVVVPAESAMAPKGTYLQQKLVLMVTAKKPPDLVIFDQAALKLYVENGVLQPIDEVKEGILASGITEEDLTATTLQEHLYAVPYGGAATVIALTAPSRFPTEAKAFLVHILGLNSATPLPQG